MANYYSNLASEAGIDDASDVSDVDPDEVAKLIEDIDDLDADLFGSTLKKKTKPSAPEKKQIKSVLKTASGESTEKQQKPKVTFQSKADSFDEVLSDIKPLSQSAKDKTAETIASRDNEQGAGKAVEGGTAKADVTSKKDIILDGSNKPTVPSPLTGERKDKSKVIAELFSASGGEKRGEDAHIKPKQDNSRKGREAARGDWLGLADTRDDELKQGGSKVSSKKDIFDDDGDILGGMGFDDGLKKSKDTIGGRRSEKRTIMDELLGREETKSAPSIARKSEPEERAKSADEKNVTFGSYMPSVSSGRQPRRPAGRRHPSSSAIDPLSFSPDLELVPQSSADVASPAARQSPVSSRRGSRVDFVTYDEQSVADRSVPERRLSRQLSNDQFFRGGGGDSSLGQQKQATDPLLPQWLGGSRERRQSVTTPDPIKPPQTFDQMPQSDIPNPIAPAAQMSFDGLLDPMMFAQSGDLIKQHTEQLMLLQSQQEDLLQKRIMEQQRQQQLAMTQKSQQEQQLALLKQQQEQHLALLQQKQQEILMKQDLQLKLLLQQQQQKQQQMEMEFKLQEERLRSQIQAVTSLAPNLTSLVAAAGKEEENPKHKKEEVSEVELQGKVYKLELEKQYLESTLESLKKKHEVEVSLMEDSYKRQIIILEAAMDRSEKRLKEDNEGITQDCHNKISRLQEEQAALVEKHQRKVDALHAEHAEDIQHLKDAYKNSIEQMKREHLASMEHLRQLKVHEVEAVQDASSHSRSLQFVIDKLGRSSQELSELQMKVDDQHQNQFEAREGILKEKDRELQAMRERLEKQQAATQQEREQLRALVERLELRVHQQQQEVEEERWRIREEKSSLEAKKRAFEAEKKHILQDVEREKNLFKKTKEAAVAEQKQLMEELLEDKQSIAAERSRIETTARLQNLDAKEFSREQMVTPADIAEMQVEVEAALKVVEEERQRTLRERENLKKQHQALSSERQQMELHKREVEAEKEKLQDLADEIRARALDAEEANRMAGSMREEGRSSLKEARRIEAQHKERLDELQKLLSELHMKEKTVAEDKLDLVKERLELEKMRKELMCPYCRGYIDRGLRTDISQVYAGNLGSNGHRLAGSKDIVDPKLTILRLEAERDGYLNETDFLTSFKSSASLL